MSKTPTFVDSVLFAFKKINSEINDDTLEHDFSPRFARYFCNDVLGFKSEEIRFERGRTDITLLDENNFRVVLIETKRPKEDLSDEKWQNQAASYADSTTKYAGLTNGYRFLMWGIKNGKRTLEIDINFKEIFDSKKDNDKTISSHLHDQIAYLENITKKEIWNESKYDKFNDFYATIDVSDNQGFEKLLERLHYITDNLLLKYTHDTFDEFLAGYHEYQRKLKEIEIFEKQVNDKKASPQIADKKIQIHNHYKKYAPFVGYYEWLSLSGRSGKDDEENKNVFCKESIYVFLNRLLFIRICEDKALLKKRISNGGIEQLRELLSENTSGESDGAFKQILFSSYATASSIYSHLFEKGNPLAWYESGGEDLNRALKITLWTLNQFDFSKIDRDVIGKIYEKYLPKEERKRLGEFYTPDEVIDYILDVIGYEPSKAIEERDLIDPSCGSGGFLVRACRRLIARYVVKFGKATPKESMDIKKWKDVLARLSSEECGIIIESVSKHIHGFDLNPFAVHITEMNLLFQIIDLYQKIRQTNTKFELGRFQIYQTDSLELPHEANLLEYTSPTGKMLAKDISEINTLKHKKFDYVVGNPPWLGILRIGKSTLEKYKKYESAKGKFDIYILFIELGIKLLSDKGKLGYITQNRFTKTDYAEAIRGFIVKNSRILHLDNFGDLKVFEDAINYPAIIILQKKIDDSSFTYVEFKEKSEQTNSRILLEELRKTWTNENVDSELFTSNKADQKQLKDSGWIFGSSMSNSLFEKLSSMPKLETFTEDIMQGVTTGGKGSDKIFYINKNNIDTLKLEKEYLKPVYRGRDIRKYYKKEEEQVLLFPYDESGVPMELKYFPRIKNYLEPHQEFLANRHLDGKLITDWNKQWFELWRKREPVVFTKKKIICPRVAETNRFAIDEDGHYLSDSAVAIIPKDINIDLLLGILNSKFAQWVITNVSPYVQGKYYNYSATYLNKIPIKIPSSSNEEETAKNIVNSVKNIQKNIKNNISENSDLIKLVDDYVFKLYGLTEKEQLMIKKSVPDVVNEDAETISSDE